MIIAESNGNFISIFCCNFKPLIGSPFILLSSFPVIITICHTSLPLSIPYICGFLIFNKRMNHSVQHPDHIHNNSQVYTWHLHSLYLRLFYKT